MQQPLLARPSFGPSVLGLTIGALTSLFFAVLLGTSAAADREPSLPRAVLEATHLPPLLVATGEKPKLTFDVHCAPAGIEDPEQPCAVTGSLFVRRGASAPFAESLLHAEQDDGLARLTASLPEGSDAGDMEYYAELETSGGELLRVPADGATYHAYPLTDPIDVRASLPGATARRRGTRVASASWGDGPNDAGLEQGRNVDPIGAASFDVDAKGSVVLLDEAHRRALRWAPGAARPSRIALSIDGRLADVTLDHDGSLYVLESVGAPGRHPLVRRFDDTGRELDAVEAGDASPSQIRLGPDGPVALQQPSHLWMPVSSGGTPLSPRGQRSGGRVGRLLRSGSEIVTYRTGNELRIAVIARGQVRTSWRITSPATLGEVQLAEPLGNRMVVVLRTYDDASDRFQVLVLNRDGVVRQFAVSSADWAEASPLSRFRLAGARLYQLGSDPTGVFVDRYDLEVR
jgi:hypothetical protein